ncbi:MAG: phytanoyl-CoA dioxygenase family protein [Burkholderiales bacterium]|nr:phytanoyl-CoA dioxygenase family protein [Burkholderiales bacterium]
MTQDRFSDGELARFQEDGFVVVRALADAGTCQRILDVARDHLARAMAPVEYEAQLHYPGAPASLDAPGGHTVRRLLQACARDAAFRHWGASAALAGRLRQLLGPEVLLAQAHHNCVMTKQPRYSSVTGWHQDIRYWSFARPDLVSVWLALGRETPENGCLSFIPGTHRMHFAGERLDPALFLREDLPENQALIARGRTPVLDAGDVVFFHCRTFHAAGANRTDAAKFSLVFTYHAAGNAPLPGSRSASLPDIAL